MSPSKSGQDTAEAPRPEDLSTLDIQVAEEENYLREIDARTHVYLQSLLNMTDPIRQMLIEEDDLKGQWSPIAEAKATIDPENDFYFLEKHHILEHGLEDAFVERYDLCVFAHELMTPNMSEESAMKALEGFVKMFQPAQGDADDIHAQFWKVFSRILATLLALHIKESRKLSSVLVKKKIAEIWDSEKKPCAEQLSDNVDKAITVARIAAASEHKLHGLFHDMLILVLEQLRKRVQTIVPPSESELIKEFIERHESKVNEAYNHPPQDFDDRAGDLDATWLDELEKGCEQNESTVYAGKDPGPQATNGKAAEADAVFDKDGASSEVIEDAHSSVQSSQEERSDVVVESIGPIPEEHRAIIGWREGVVDKGAEVEGEDKAEKSQGKQKVLEHGIDPPRQLPQPTEYGNETVVMSPVKSNSASTLTKRVGIIVGIPSMMQDGEESDFFEDGGDDTPAPAPKRRRIIQEELQDTVERDWGVGTSKATVASGRVTKSGLSQLPPSQLPLKPIRQTTLTMGKKAAAPAPAASAANERRRKNRAWSKEEVERLMNLVPRFQYEPSQSAGRKRTIKWAALKRYDEQHGNILQHRDQVMLKDKYREKSDHGQHRGQVNEILQARSAAIPRHQFPKHPSSRL